MKKLFEEFGSQIVAAFVGGVVAIVLATTTWLWTGIWDKVKYEAAASMLEHLALVTEQKVSKTDKDFVSFQCRENYKLVSASCVGQENSAVAAAYRPAAGPIFTDTSKGVFECWKGHSSMQITATAICARLKGN